MKNIFKIIALSVFLTFTCSNLQARQEAVNIFQESRPAPERKIFHENGKQYSLYDFEGQFVVALFWSRTCAPCIKELKDLNVFYKNAQKENIRLILISPKSEWVSPLEQRLFLKKYGASDVEFYTDKKGNLAADFGIFSTPHAVLIDENSQEIGRVRGTAKWADKRVLNYIKNLKKNKSE